MKNLKTKNKILLVLLIMILLANTFIPYISVASYELGNDIILRGYGSVENHVRNKESGDYAITTDLVRLL